MEYFITIAVLVVCALLFTKVEHDALQTVSLLVAIVASLYLASLLDLGFIPSVLVILGSFPLLILIFAFLDGPRSSKPYSRVDLSDPSTSALIDEAIEVINDMLEVGGHVWLYSYSYNGLIIPIAMHTRGNTYCIRISMADIDNLRQVRDSQPKIKHMPQYQDLNERIDVFLKKYDHCYDAQNRSYVYRTQHTIVLQKGDKDRAGLHALLHQQIKQRCPLACFENGLLYTEGVPRG